MSVRIDYSALENKILKKAYKLSDVQDKIIKVAFDIVRFKDEDDAAKLWQIQSNDDGDYIVALYDTSDDMISTASIENPWKVEYNKLGGIVNFYYKNYPIAKLASNKLGVQASEIETVISYLPNKLNENKKLRSALLKQADKQVLNKYPELKGV